MQRAQRLYVSLALNYSKNKTSGVLAALKWEFQPMENPLNILVVIPIFRNFH